MLTIVNKKESLELKEKKLIIRCEKRKYVQNVIKEAEQDKKTR